tara:strand:+ start:284 stop:496 length:213 start_codon:yes stop_codon:yes gene_type:complete
MSKEHLAQTDFTNIEDPKARTHLLKSKAKVDINNLLKKVRTEEKKEKKENFIFLGLVCGVVAITGVIASL